MVFLRDLCEQNGVVIYTGSLTDVFLSLFLLFGCVWADGEKVARFIRKLPAKITVGIHYRLLIHRVAEEFMD